MIGELPESLKVGDSFYDIRTDFRVILDILSAFNDPELSEQEKATVMLDILYIHPDDIPGELCGEAITQANWFIDCGIKENEKKPRVMEWEKDATIIFPAINHIAGREVRERDVYTHWWTFVGYYMEIREGVFSTVLRIRQKMASGEKMEKWEKKFYHENTEMCSLHIMTEEEEKDLEFINNLIG